MGLFRYSMVVFALLMVFAAFSPLPSVSIISASPIRYVALTGSDVGDCTSSSLPCRTIQYAVNQAASGDTILVAGGTYTYSADVDPCPFLLTRAVVCFVDKRLTILGGYSTNNWSKADPSANPTIIDGQSQYRGVAAIGYNTTNAHLHMEGFTIQNCRAQGPTYLNPYDPSGVGGGMLVQHASVTLKDMRFYNNRAIGADTNSGAGGQADGAALRIEEPWGETTSLLQRVIFDGNESHGGQGPERGGVAFGALYIYKANVVIEDSVFMNNLARAGNSSGSGIFGSPSNADALGGGIAIQESTVVLKRVTVTNNQVQGGSAAQQGGGGFGGGIFVENFGTQNYVTINDSYIANNVAIGGAAATGGYGAGGGVDVDSSDITIERTYIISNSVIGGSSSSGIGASGAGGGIYVFPGWPRTSPYQVTLNNVVIAWNMASQGGGTSHPGYGGGGGISIHGVNANLNHVTIAHNRLGSPLVLGQGLLVQPWPSPNDPQRQAVVNLNQSIIANHTVGGANAAAIVVQQNSMLTFNQGLFTGNTKNTNADGSPVPVGIINGLNTMQSASSAGFIAADPPYYNYHLRIDSYAIDKGTGSSVADDIDRQSRPYGNSFDFGADEYHPFSLVVAPGNGILRLDWTAGAQVLMGGVGHYEVNVICEAGANPPNETGCGQPLNVGTNTTLTLTGLTNFKRYIIEIKAYDASNTLIATSVRVSAFPTNIFVFLPLVLK